MILLFLNCSSLVFFELGLKVAAVHFDAQLHPGPDVFDSSPDFLLVQRLHKVAYNLLEVIEGLGLDLRISALQITHRKEPSGDSPTTTLCGYPSTCTTIPQSSQNPLFRTTALKASEMTFKHDRWLSISNAQSVQAASKQNQLIICLYEEL